MGQSEGLSVESRRVFTRRLSDDASLRLYSDCRLHNLKIADIQKGLVLLFNDREVVEEGIGFGAPVAIYGDAVLFASSAKVAEYKKDKRLTVSKSFLIDVISRKRIWKGPFINERFRSLVHKVFASIYRKEKGLKSLFTALLVLEGRFGLNTCFVKVRPRGSIVFSYAVVPDGVEIEVDLRELEKKGCQEILIMNEQGSAFFPKYDDSDGFHFVGDKLGAWERVEADCASLTDLNGTLSFCLKSIPGATFYRGREQVKNTISWVGLSYSLSPSLLDFSYKIWVRENRHG